MKIAVLDGYTANPGDQSWEALAALGEVSHFDRTSPAQVLERCQGAEVILTNKVVLDAAKLEQLPDLKYIGVTATGINIVDIDAANRAGITVTNVPGYSTDSVAQLTFALILELANQVGSHSASVHQGQWANSSDFSYTLSPQIELSGRKLGVIGYGDIGQAVARIGSAMGMDIIVHSRTAAKVPADLFRSLDDVFEQSDIISLHCPLTAENADMVNSERLDRMKPSAWIINTARGPLVNEQALADALNNGQIAGAGLDVLCKEPMTRDNPLLGAKNCVITPHIAWATQEARKRLIDIVAANLRLWQNGAPQNVVN
ncbi:MAG: D-2-hydroxyacid dehydrogenase [Verrucomicrobiota bacterium]